MIDNIKSNNKDMNICISLIIIIVSDWYFCLSDHVRHPSRNCDRNCSVGIVSEILPELVS